MYRITQNLATDWLVSIETRGVQFLVKSALGGLIWFLSYIFRGLEESMLTLLILQTVDVLAGFIRAGYTKDLSSQELKNGIAKKVLIWLVVVVAAQVDFMLKLDYIKQGAIFFFAGAEALSIVENAALCGVVVPEWLRELLRNWHEQQKAGNPS